MSDSHPLLQEPKPKSSTLKKVVVAAIALSFVLGYDSCHALPGGKVESSAGGHAYEDSDGALGRKALASAAAVLAGLAF